MPISVPILFFLSAFALVGTAAPVSFENAYQAALTKESNNIQKLQTEVADEKVSQGFGQVLPKFTLNGAYERQDQPPNVANPFYNPNQWYARLSLTQPIFHGLSEFAAYRALKARHRASLLNDRGNQLSLYSSVASAFYSLLAAQRDLEDVKVLSDLTAKRVTDIKQRVRIGRSRKGDLLSAEAQALTLNAEVVSATRELESAREQFKLVTGLDPAIPLLDDEKTTWDTKLTLPELLKQLDTRPDIQAAKEEYSAADEGVSAAFGSHLPQIDFSGNYYLKRTGNLANVKWDLGVIAVIPIFNGGVTQSTVRENIKIRQTKELQLQYARRNAEKDLKVSYQNYVTLLEQSKAYEKAYELADANYKEQNKDYRYGLVTNLDVLTAMNSLQETKRSKNKTFYQAKAAYKQLLAASGRVP